MSDHPFNAPRLYITDDEITSVPDFADQTVFAIRAPSAQTSLHIPTVEQQPDEDGNVKQIYR